MSLLSFLGKILVVKDTNSQLVMQRVSVKLEFVLQWFDNILPLGDLFYFHSYTFSNLT